MKDFLRACVAAKVPVVGICFGHQILAEALGGRAAKSDRGWGLGVQDYEIVNRPGWAGHVPDRFSMRALHQDQVLELPADATVLARSVQCEFAAVAYGDPETPDAISLQPHPEFGREFLDELIAARTGTLLAEDVAAEARAGLDRGVHDREWARLIVDYLHRMEAARAAA